MFKNNIAFYLGEEKKGGFSGIFAENNLFLCFEIYTGIEEGRGYKIIEQLKSKVKEKLSSQKYLINSLAEFDDFISLFITENNFPTGFSLASGYLKENILYLKTINEGKIYIRRKNQFGLLLDGNNIASGKIEENDLFLLTTENFLNLIGGKEKIKEYFNNKNPKQIIDEITPLLKNKNDIGSIALIVEFFEEKDIEKQEKLKNNDRKLKLDFFENLKKYFLIMKNSKKTLTLITAFLFFILLIWSATGAIKRKNIIAFDNKEKQSRELILQKIQMAQDVAFLNMDRALILLKESNQEFENLKKEAEKLKIKSKKLDELQNIIKTAEEKIIKKEKAKIEEFFDLAIDNKQALGDKVYLNQDKLYILDKKNGAIYILSLEKKSLEKIEAKEVKQSSIIAGIDKKIFFYIKGDGIYQSNNLEKPKKIIDKDKDWGELIDIAVYNGNLYFLDREKDEIWKYLASENGFSEKTSYFAKNEAIDLSLINFFSIDGSIYLLSEKNIYKYTSGLRQSFKFDLPSNNFSFSRIFTDINTEKIYILDKKNSAVYVLGKTGDYIEQINSDIFSKADGFFVYKDKVYVLLKSKIYKIIN